MGSFDPKLFETTSVQGSVGDFGIEGLLSTPKPGAEKPQEPEDWMDAPAFLLADSFGARQASGLSFTKMRSGSVDGFLFSRDGPEIGNSLLGSLDLADFMPPDRLDRGASSVAMMERMPSRDLQALDLQAPDLPAGLGTRQQSGFRMSISGSTENFHGFMDVVERQALPASDKGSLRALLQPSAAPQASSVPQVSAQLPSNPPSAQFPMLSITHAQPTAAVHQLGQGAPSGHSCPVNESQPIWRTGEPAHARSAAAKAAATRDPQESKEGSGSHVKNRPEMQRRARAGQEHWLQEVRAMRTRWDARQECTGNAAFRWQVDMCGQLQIKSQHECILRALQMAAADELITPLPFSQDTDSSFLGWTGFQVHQEKAQQFRREIESLFPVPLPENTLHTAFRRAGLVPDKWTSGWLGMSPFRFSSQTRQHYR